MKLPRPVERWQSRTTFVLALAMAAVGLGNSWRFATLMGEHGGAPFLLSYIFCLLVVVVPLLVAEVTLGTHGRGSPFLTMTWATATSQRSRLWLLVALPACLGGFLLLVICLMLGGWSLAYAYRQQLGDFSASSLEDVAAFLAQQLQTPGELMIWQAVAAAILCVVIAAGVRRGIGLLAWLGVPLLITLFAVLIAYSLDYGDLAAAGAFLFNWQPMDFDGGSFIAALVHALYTLSVGVAAAMTYGAYAPDKLPVVRSVLAVAVFDLVLSVAAGIALYPLLITSNLLPSDGFGLLFIGVPYAFGNSPFGDFYGALFFVALFIAMLGSAVALLEPVVAVLVQQFRVRRLQAALIMAGLALLLSLFATTGLGNGGDLMAWLDRASTVWLIPAALLLLALFVGWRMPRAVLRDELSREPDILFDLWYFLLRFVAPPVIVLIWLWSLALP